MHAGRHVRLSLGSNCQVAHGSVARVRLGYREIFFGTFGLGPWTCHGCGEEVRVEKLNIHHLDHDHSNDDPTNLVAMHSRCHAKHHRPAQRGYHRSPQAKARISATMRKHVRTVEHCANIAAGKRGRPRKTVKVTECSICGMVSNPSAMASHFRASGHTARDQKAKV